LKPIIFISLVILFSCTHSPKSKRDHWQKPDKIFEAISSFNDKNKVFCEIGPGEGYFSFKAAPLYGHVYASELSDKSIKEFLLSNESKGVKNLTVIKANEDDPLFPVAKCDVIFMGMVYHHIENRVEYLINIKKYLAENGKIVNLDNVIDIKKYEGTGKRLPSKECRFSKDEFIAEAKLAKFSNIKEYNVLPMQYLIELQ
jgi:SAM-dependent methyltransferase